MDEFMYKFFCWLFALVSVRQGLTVYLRLGFTAVRLLRGQVCAEVTTLPICFIFTYPLQKSIYKACS